jgi:hypothetical protein
MFPTMSHMGALYNSLIIVLISLAYRHIISEGLMILVAGRGVNKFFETGGGDIIKQSFIK